jgi:hypothetical protein
MSGANAGFIECGGIFGSYSMTYFDLKSPSVIWFNAWRSQIASAKAYPEEAQEYCRAAVVSQAMHVIWMAQEIVKETSRER